MCILCVLTTETEGKEQMNKKLHVRKQQNEGMEARPLYMYFYHFDFEIMWSPYVIIPKRK